MLLKISQKKKKKKKQILTAGENKQFLTLTKRPLKTGSFLFHCGDVEKLTATQYKEMITYFKNNGFVEV